MRRIRIKTLKKKMKNNEILEKYLSKRKKLVKRFSLATILLILIVFLLTLVDRKNEVIAQISIEGIINNPVKTLKELKKIKDSPNVKALLVKVNSPGGTFVSSKDLYDKIKEIGNEIPVVTFMREMATSGGYLVSLASQKIFSSSGTITGSIGVILQTAEVTKLLEKIGIKPIVIKSGDLKATPNPIEIFDNSDENYLKKIIRVMQEEFLEIVKDNRRVNENTISKISDGRIFTGNQAVKLNLIDAVGSETDAIEWLKNEANLDDNVKIINYSEETNYEKLINLKFFDNKINALQTKLYNGFLAIWIPNL